MNMIHNNVIVLMMLFVLMIVNINESTKFENYLS